MYGEGKLSKVTETTNHGLSILGINEARYTGSRQQRLVTGELFLYSDHENENPPHTQGVALLLSRAAQSALIGWEALGPRIITTIFRTTEKRIAMNIIRCYASTNDSDDQIKQDFYNQLQSAIQRYTEIGIPILMGDINSKIGSDNTGYEKIMRHEGLGVIIIMRNFL